MNRIEQVLTKADLQALRYTSLSGKGEMGALAGLPAAQRANLKARAIAGEKVSAKEALQRMPTVSEKTVVSFRMKRRRKRKLTKAEAETARRIRAKISGATIAALRSTSLDCDDELDALARLPVAIRDDLIARVRNGEKLSAIEVRNAKLKKPIVAKWALGEALYQQLRTTDEEIVISAITRLAVHVARTEDVKNSVAPDHSNVSELQKHIQKLEAELCDANLQLEKVAADLNKAQFEPVSFATVLVEDAEIADKVRRDSAADRLSTRWLNDNGVDPCGRDRDLDDFDLIDSDTDDMTEEEVVTVLAEHDGLSPHVATARKSRWMPLDQLFTYIAEAKSWRSEKDI